MITQARPKLLTAEEECELARRRDAGCIESRNRLVERNIGFALKLAQPYVALNPRHEDDLVSEAVGGLLDAADRFDPGRGFRFTTYAGYWVRRAIVAWLKDHAGLIRVPRYLHGSGLGKGNPECVAAAARAFGKVASIGVRPATGELDPPDRRGRSSAIPEDVAAGLAEELRRLDPTDARIVAGHFGLDGKAEKIHETAIEVRMGPVAVERRLAELVAFLGLKLESRGLIDRGEMAHAHPGRARVAIGGAR